MARKSNLYNKVKHVSKAKFKKTSQSINPSRIKWSSMNKHKRKNRKKK